MFISARPARACAAATATVQVEWSASVMRDTMVGHKQLIMFKLLQYINTQLFFVFTVRRKSKHLQQD